MAIDSDLIINAQWGDDYGAAGSDRYASIDDLVAAVLADGYADGVDAEILETDTRAGWGDAMSGQPAVIYYNPAAAGSPGYCGQPRVRLTAQAAARADADAIADPEGWADQALADYIDACGQAPEPGDAFLAAGGSEADRLSAIAMIIGHPDWAATVEQQMADRIDSYGDLTDIDTGDEIRQATAQEWAASLRAARRDGGRGAIDVDGRTCYVV